MGRILVFLNSKTQALFLNTPKKMVRKYLAGKNQPGSPRYQRPVSARPFSFSVNLGVIHYTVSQGNFRDKPINRFINCFRRITHWDRLFSVSHGIITPRPIQGCSSPHHESLGLCSSKNKSVPLFHEHDQSPMNEN